VSIIKSSSVLVLAFAAAACVHTDPLPTASPLAFTDPAIPYYREKCQAGSFTGHGIGYQRCMNLSLEHEALARAGGGPNDVYTAELPPDWTIRTR
jgi:hypothetical protein